MAYDPHLRVTMSGTLPGGEIFSMGVAMANPDDSLAAVQGWLGIGQNSTQHDDLVADCVAYFGSANVAILHTCTLTKVTIAPIGTDGRYSGPSVERTVAQAGGFQVATAANRRPNSSALAITLHTAGDIGRIKGRYYLPPIGYDLGDNARYDAAVADVQRAAARVFLEDLANEPGYDVLGLVPVVASQGRKNKDGSVRVGPDNHKVTGVSVGAVPDVIRRRRNKQLEGPRTISTVDA